MQIEEPEQHRKPNQKQIPWVEKYRPSSLQQVIAHEEIIATIKKFQSENKLPNLLLYGPPGTGKTSTILALAKEIYGKHYNQMVLELNASNDRGIGTVRETIKRFAESQSLHFSKENNVKLVILDEADAMTSAAQFALRRIIEKFSRGTRFCFICNYVSKIIPALQSRCTRFKFKQIPFEQSAAKMQEICLQENLNVTPDGIRATFELCEGDMRRIVNMLQSLSMSVVGADNSEQIVSQKFVYSYTGMADPEQMENIFRILMNSSSIAETYTIINESLVSNGIALSLLLKAINQILLQFDMPENMKVDINLNQQIHLVDRLAEIEYRLSISCSNQLQLLALIGVFYEARQVYQT